MNESIKKRLADLESHIMPEPCFCMVELPDGSEAEKAVEEWFEHRREWKWKRLTRGGNISAVLLVLAAISDEVAEYCAESGDTDGAARMTAETADYLAEYERRARR